MKTIEDFEEMIRFRKTEFNMNGWNALDISVKDLASAGSEMANAAEGMKRNMLEGDSVITGNADAPDKTFTVRYYCDNLDSSRRRIF